MASKNSSETVVSSDEPFGTSVENELREARLELVRLRSVAAELARKLDDAVREVERARAQAARDHEQLRSMRRSASWRVTLPLRARARFLQENVRFTRGK